MTYLQIIAKLRQNQCPVQLYQQLVNNGEAEDLEEAYEKMMPIASLSQWAICSNAMLLSPGARPSRCRIVVVASTVYVVVVMVWRTEKKKKMPKRIRRIRRRRKKQYGGIALHDPRNHWSEKIFLQYCTQENPKKANSSCFPLVWTKKRVGDITTIFTNGPNRFLKTQ